MTLRKIYPPGFEALVRAYPNWPKGRTVKTDAFKAYTTVGKELNGPGGFNPEDDADMLKACENQVLTRARWQKGHRHGPQGLQRWIRAHGFNLKEIDYETVVEVRRKDRGQAARPTIEPTQDEQNRAFVRQMVRRGQEVPPEFERFREAQ